MLRWISSVPPAMDTAGTDRMISAMTPQAGEKRGRPGDGEVSGTGSAGDVAAGELAE